ncbi:hypothetical protein VP01_2212g2, partial [Puccinia sorghi]
PIYLWFVSLIISHRVPTSVCGARKKSVYLEEVFQIFGIIVMALVKLSDGCPQCQKAIDRGAKLPATSLQEKKSLIKKTLNKILYLWLLCQAIPWTCIEDPYLRAAFHYCECGAELFKQKWAATFGHVIYLELQEAMLHLLRAANSKFTLIHDVLIYR